METSQEFDKIGMALLAAQRKFMPVVKSEKAKIQTKGGGSYEYAYAALDTVMEAVIDALHDQNVLLTQEATTEGAKVTVVTRLEHPESSQFRITSGITLDAGSTGPQPIGSAITYARRYDLIAALGIAPHDDDGASAQQAYDKSRQQGQKQQQKQAPANQSQQGQSQQSQKQQAANRGTTPGEPQKAAADVIKETLKKAGCKNMEDANLVLRWASGDAFGDAQPLQAIVDPRVGKPVLDRLRKIHKEGVTIDTWMKKAREFFAAAENMKSEF